MNDMYTKLLLQSGLLLFELEIDLPKLTTFIAEDEESGSFSNVRSIVLESASSLFKSSIDMPNLNQVVLPRCAFDMVNEFKVESESLK